MDDAKLTGKARGVASCLTYNEEPQGSAKHLLRELAHRMDQRNISIYRDKETKKLSIKNQLGQSRSITFKERCLFLFFKIIPKEI